MRLAATAATASRSASRRLRRSGRTSRVPRRPPPRRRASPRRSEAHKDPARPCPAKAGRHEWRRPRAGVAPDAPPKAPAVPGSPWSLASVSASEEAGRWLAFASRSSRASTSRVAGRRNRKSGERAAPAPSANRTTPPIRMARGANCHAPAHEAARKRITTARAKTSGGQMRSTRSARRAEGRERPEPPAVDR